MRVVSCNLLHGIDLRDGCIRLEPWVELLAGFDADLIVLQEVDRGLPRSDGADQAAELGRALGLHAIFAPALIGSPDSGWEVPRGLDDDRPGYGVALLSRSPVPTRALRLPGGGAHTRTREPSLQRPGWDREPRVALLADIAWAGGLRVATTHLSYLPWRALRQLRRAARACDGAGGALLIGDLNLPPSWVRRALRGWDHAGGPPTYPAWQPRIQLDQAHSRGDAEVVAVEVGPRGPSDHLPVVVTVEVAP